MVASPRAAVLPACLSAAFACTPLGTAAQSLADSIRDRLSERVAPEAPALEGFYARRGFQPAWSGDAGPLPRVVELQRIVSEADRDGLRPADYPLPPLRPALDPDVLAGFDLALTRAALRYAADLADGRVDPAAVDTAWTAAPRAIEVAYVLAGLLDSWRLPAIRSALSPPHAGYTRLRAPIAAGGLSSRKAWRSPRATAGRASPSCGPGSP